MLDYAIGLTGGWVAAVSSEALHALPLHSYTTMNISVSRSLSVFIGLLPLLAAGASAQDEALPGYVPVAAPALTLPAPTGPDRFFIRVDGGYAFSSDRDMPGLPGAMFELGMRGQTWKILHEGFVALGFYSGSDTLTFEEAHDRFGVYPSYDGRYRPRVKHEVQTIPLMVGYRFNVPLGRSPLSLYAGARCGVSFFQDEFIQPPWHPYHCDDDDWYDDCRGDDDLELSRKSMTRFSYAFDGGLRLALDESVSMTLGYEYYRVGSMKPLHIIQLGVTWSF